MSDPLDWRNWVPQPAGSLVEHQHRMQYDVSYREMIQTRWIKAKFLEQIRAAVDGPMSEYLWETFGPEVEVPEYE